MSTMPTRIMRVGSVKPKPVASALATRGSAENSHYRDQDQELIMSKLTSSICSSQDN
jgi:hypothetical protein